MKQDKTSLRDMLYSRFFFVEMSIEQSVADNKAEGYSNIYY